jgi:hypothetical protein
MPEPEDVIMAIGVLVIETERACRDRIGAAPPANYSANWSSTPPATTSPPANHPDQTPNNKTPEPTNAGSGVSDVPRHHRAVLTCSGS